MDRRQQIQVLKSVPFIRFLSEEQIVHLLMEGQVIPLKANQMLFEEGAHGNAMYIVLSGKVEVFRKNKSIAIHEEGSFFGEMALLESKPRSASVRSIINSLLLEISNEKFHLYLSSNPKVVYEILKVMSSRGREELDTIDWGFGELKKSEERYRKIVESVSDIIIQTEPDGKIVFANRAVSSLGYEPDEMIGRYLNSFLDSDVQDIPFAQIMTRRVGPRATTDLEVNFKVNEHSTLYSIIRSASFLVTTCGMWDVPNELVWRKGSKKKLLGTLLVARRQKMELNM